MSYVKIAKVETLNATDSNVTDGYWVAGEVTSGFELGHPVVMQRKVRNGVSVPGVFKTSPVTAYVARGNQVLHFSTANSVYTVEPWEQ